MVGGHRAETQPVSANQILSGASSVFSHGEGSRARGLVEMTSLPHNCSPGASGWVAWVQPHLPKCCFQSSPPTGILFRSSLSLLNANPSVYLLEKLLSVADCSSILHGFFFPLFVLLLYIFVKCQFQQGQG